MKTDDHVYCVDGRFHHLSLQVTKKEEEFNNCFMIELTMNCEYRTPLNTRIYFDIHCKLSFHGKTVSKINCILPVADGTDVPYVTKQYIRFVLAVNTANTNLI